MRIAVFAAAVAGLVFLANCGKKSDDSSTSSTAEKAVTSLSVTCNSVPCIGTEGK